MATEDDEIEPDEESDEEADEEEDDGEEARGTGAPRPLSG